MTVHLFLLGRFYLRNCLLLVRQGHALLTARRPKKPPPLARSIDAYPLLCGASLDIRHDQFHRARILSQAVCCREPSVIRLLVRLCGIVMRFFETRHSGRM